LFSVYNSYTNYIYDNGSLLCGIILYPLLLDFGISVLQ
jgi:hypothetical protein